jgi:hypothetical protein
MANRHEKGGGLDHRPSPSRPSLAHSASDHFVGVAATETRRVQGAGFLTRHHADLIVTRRRSSYQTVARRRTHDREALTSVSDPGGTPYSPRTWNGQTAIVKRV